MRYSDFTGPTYSGKALTVGGDRCINFRSVKVEATGEYHLHSTPGHKLFTTLPAQPLQKTYTEPATKRMFAITGSVFYEVFSDGTYHSYGQIDGGYYRFASNAEQIMLTCATTHTGWIFTLSANTLARITSAGFLGADDVCMIDNYFITRLHSSRKFQISALLDGLTWDAADIGVAEAAPDNLVGEIDNHSELWLFGSQHTEVFIDTGAALFPFERETNIYIEQGLAATESLAKVDNTLYWIGQYAYGSYRIYRAYGYTPQGVSNSSIEYFINQYAKEGALADAKGFGYMNSVGRSFYVLNFPSATSDIDNTGRIVTNVIRGACWVYDIGGNMWHEWQSLDKASGRLGSPLSLYHTFAFGKHLTCGGDNTGNIYELSDYVYRDNGNPIKRIRRAPSVMDELKIIRHRSLKVNAEVGVIER
ncbi:MAG: hypothetical protein ACREHG_00890 [Candidatus Saccharimonadales bacterium]